MSKLRLRYQTLEFELDDIHIRTLRDNQQFEDPDGEAEDLGISSAAWPLFGVVWASGSVLADRMWTHDTADKRILEVGCGIALASLVLNHRSADITATDRHPEAESFLQENARINGDPVIPFLRIDWSDPPSTLGLFDLIIGSDLLYERAHVEALSGFIEQHAKPDCEVLIVDPGRGESARFSRRMEGYGFVVTREEFTAPESAEHPFDGHIIHLRRAAV